MNNFFKKKIWKILEEIIMSFVCSLLAGGFGYLFYKVIADAETNNVSAIKLPFYIVEIYKIWGKWGVLNIHIILSLMLFLSGCLQIKAAITRKD